MPDPNVPLPDRMPHGGDPRDPDLGRQATPLALVAGALALVAGALAASVVVYAGIAWFLTSEAVAAGFEPAGLAGSARAALIVGGLVMLLVAPLVEKRIRESGRGAAPAQALSVFRTATVVGFALREAAALFGLLIAVLTGEPFWCFALSAAALVAMIAAWPTRGKLERYVRGAVAPS